NGSKRRKPKAGKAEAYTLCTACNNILIGPEIGLYTVTFGAKALVDMGNEARRLDHPDLWYAVGSIDAELSPAVISQARVRYLDGQQDMVAAQVTGIDGARVDAEVWFEKTLVIEPQCSLRSNPQLPWSSALKMPVQLHLDNFVSSPL